MEIDSEHQEYIKFDGVRALEVDPNKIPAAQAVAGLETI